MPRGVFNWKFRDVDKFLKSHGFHLHHSKGGHYFYYGHSQNELRMVCVPFHGSKSIGLKTMKGIISQSGLSKEKWLK